MPNGYGYTFEEFGPEVAMPGQQVYAGGEFYQAAGAEAYEQMPLSAAIAAAMAAPAQLQATLPLKQAGFPLLPAVGLIPAAAGALGMTLPAWLLAALGIAGAGYGAYQALGGGEGEGLFGLDILGGGGTGQLIDGIPFGGPGLAEPAARQVLKEWHVNYDWGRLQYYLVQMPGSKTRKIAMYNTRTRKWKVWVWRTPHLAVIGKNMPSHKQLTRLKRNLSRHAADAQTILKITRPTAYAKQQGYRKYKRR